MVDFPVIIMVWKIHFFLKIKPMNELFIIKENMNHNYLDTIIKDIVDKYLNHPYKGIIVIDNYLSTSLDEHVDCMDDI